MTVTEFQTIKDRDAMSILTPDIYLTDVQRIDLDALLAEGIDTLLVDLDNTLLPRDSDKIPDAVRAWIASVRERGMSICLVSNNWHTRVKAIADDLGVDLVARAVKPLPFAFLRALSITGSTRRRTAMAGDQLFTDVLGGNLLGIKTVLVLPVSRSDLPHTLLLRRVEAVLLAGRQPLP